MYYENVNENNLNQLKDKSNIIVEVYSQWCGPCKMLKNVLKDLGEKRNDIHVVPLEIEDNQQFAAEHKVIGTPTTFIYFDGLESKPKIVEGFLPEEEWVKLLEERK